MRLDLTNYKIYVIDPPNCEDADDAFTIIDNVLWVFIADPTNEFHINDDIYKHIIKKGTTKYSLFKKPDHLFPKNIVDKCSLNNNIKNAIGVKMLLQDNNIIDSEIHLVKIKIDTHSTYYNVEIDDVIRRGIEISKILYNNRKGNGKILNDYQINLPLNENGKWIFKKDDNQVKELKNMIAEFAIKCNQIVSEKLKVNLNRICNSVNTNNPEVMIFDIIKNGVRAEYKLSDEKHLLIDDKTYTHFTSPLRRANDCLVHFLLKGCDIDLKEIDKITNNINSIIKKDKKFQYEEIKKCSILAMSEILKEQDLFVKIKIMSYTGLFLNMIMCKINEFRTQISLTIRKKNYTIGNNEIDLQITKINVDKKYDNEIFPDLENI